MSLSPARHDFTDQTPVERANALLEPLTDRKKQIRCPSPDHEDRHPSCTLYPDGFKCWSCGARGDALDYYALTNGLTLRDALQVLGAFHGPSTPRVRRMRLEEPPHLISREIAEKLVDSDQFARHWHLAKLLAMPPRLLAQRDLLGSWDYLLEIGYDVPLVWKLAGLLRGEAWLRFGDAARADDPREPGRAVCRLLNALNEGVDAA